MRTKASIVCLAVLAFSVICFAESEESVLNYAARIDSYGRSNTEFDEVERKSVDSDTDRGAELFIYKSKHRLLHLIGVYGLSNKDLLYDFLFHDGMPVRVVIKQRSFPVSAETGTNFQVPFPDVALVTYYIRESTILEPGYGSAGPLKEYGSSKHLTELLKSLQKVMLAK